MKKRITAIGINLVVIVILSLLLFFLGTWWRLQAQFSLGEEAFRRGDFTGAVAGYESAIHMYIPLHPTVEKAAQRLWDVAASCERRGDVKRALIAYRSLRSSFYAARWLVTPGGEWIAKCDARIAALVPLVRER